ncbi:glycosyltransferase [Agrococcus beijingensis]|uniref:glycosyltransferase n=1 Tax=Agrococcus beijingensis TaxID=3068634 RepID=UPI00274064FF|nr:glycosyltransferase [Agrococcus sp. REN33]
MRALILAFGTRGDVQPFAALGRALREAGHEVVLAAPSAHAELASLAGIRLEPAFEGMHEAMRTLMASPSSPLRQAPALLEATRASFPEQWRIARDVAPDVVVHHPKALGGDTVAERLGVPGVLSLPLPYFTPTDAFPIPFLAGLPGRLNRPSYQLLRATALGYGGMINGFREQLGLPPISRWSRMLTQPDGTSRHILYPYSRHILPVPADFPPEAHVTGSWFLDRDPAWSPATELAGFLEQQHDRPAVAIGFGSMQFGGGDRRRSEAVLRGVAAAGVRAVVLRGWGGLALEGGDDLLVADDVPHDWLFPRVDAVVHHGGSGTLAAGLRAGRPTLVVPFLGDQPFWGRRVEALGVGPAPLPQRRLTAESLHARLSMLVSTPSYRERASAIGERIRAEDGTGEAVRVLERLAP